MTAPLSHQAAPAKDTTAARKRRRRAPAGGASDDCFTCIKRNVKCDRRRPYCSQCLEVSNECSGYKTQLTWGVGVASRGKLRGLSLPIAKAPPVAREPKKSPSQRARASSNVTTVSNSSNQSFQWADHTDPRRQPQMPLPRAPIDIPAVTQAQAVAASAPTTPYSMSGYDYLSMSHPDNTPPSMSHGSWSSMGYSPGIMHSPEAPKYSKFPLGLVTDGLSSSVSSVNSEVDYMSPMSQSYPREDLPFMPSPTIMYDGYSTHQNSPVPQSPPTSLVLDQCRAPTSCPSLVYAPSETSPGLHSHLDVFESQLSQKMMMRECGSLSEHHPAPCIAYSF
jgi:hypothetical protein